MVKKNTKKMAWPRRAKRPIIYYSKKWKEWEAHALKEMIRYKPRKPIGAPVELQIGFFLGTRRRVDLSNLIEGPQDVLVKAGVLEDDSLIQRISAHKCLFKERVGVDITIRAYEKDSMEND